MTGARQHHAIVIEARRGIFDLRLGEVFGYWNLIKTFVRRDFITVYKQTILGPLWFVIQALLTTGVFTVVFGKIAKIPTDTIPPPLFYMAGVVFWSYFARCTAASADIFVKHAGLFGKVYFPRLCVPIANAITELAALTIQLALLVATALAFYAAGAALHPSAWLLALPLALVLMMATAAGTGLIMSALTTRYRDLTFVIGIGIQLWMYATPVIYPLSQVPERWRWLYAVNPMTSVVEIARLGFFGVGALEARDIAMAAAVAAAALATGLVLFARAEANAQDTV